MIVGSLFSGAGLLDAGLHQAGHEHAWFVEREPDRRALLARRWPGRPVHDDVRTVGAHHLEPVDCIVGGFPCKGASNIGPRTGLDHPETALWAEFARIVRELRPRYVVVENVAAIRSIHSGAVWGTVLGDLAALGYDVVWGCLRASDVGAPHERDRAFAIARHAPDIGHERARGPRLRRDGFADTDSPAADAAWDAKGGPGSPARANGERVGPGVDASPDPGRVPVGVEWCEYEPAIRRWEAIHGRAPAPLTRASGVDDGNAKVRRVRARLDRQRLSALGDGVHVYLGRLIGDALMELDREMTAVRATEKAA